MDMEGLQKMNISSEILQKKLVLTSREEWRLKRNQSPIMDNIIKYDQEEDSS